MMVAPSPRTSPSTSWWQACRAQFHRIVDTLSVVLRDRHTVPPAQIGDGQHDCALSSLYWAVPSIPESDIPRAFIEATATWPYGGVTNKEFVIALKYLGLDSDYSGEPISLRALLAARPARCVALIYGHFIPIVDGEIVGRDADYPWDPDTYVYCHWMFRRRYVRPA